MRLLLRQLERRVAFLQAKLPRGYVAYGADGEPTISSNLPALEWFIESVKILRSGTAEEKSALRAALACSVGWDNGGGIIYQVVMAFDTERFPQIAPFGASDS
jgi:hypothetical protein